MKTGRFTKTDRRLKDWNEKTDILYRIFGLGEFCRQTDEVSHPSEETLNGPLFMKELIFAENMLFKKAQAESYADELSTLQCSTPRILKTSPIYRDLPFIDKNGVMRANSRLPNETSIRYDTCCPILMPKDNKITDLFLMDYHQKFKHHNHETVLNEVIQRFQIPNLRVLLKKVRRNCQVCKIRSAIPQVPTMSRLPEERVTSFIRPFSYIVVDYFGPIAVTSRRSRVKRWV